MQPQFTCVEGSPDRVKGIMALDSFRLEHRDQLQVNEEGKNRFCDRSVYGEYPLSSTFETNSLKRIVQEEA